MRFSHQKKSIENYTGNVVKSKKIGDLTVRSFFKPPLPDPDSEYGSGSEVLLFYVFFFFEILVLTGFLP